VPHKVAAMKTNRGFTLIELMIAIAVLAIVLGLGVPSFRDAIQNNRATAAANDVVTALQLARSEAIRRRQNVVVCRRNAAGDACDDGTNWAVGWLVQSGGTPIQTWDPRNGNPNLTASANTVTFQSTGRATAAATITITFPNCTGAQSRTIGVAATGRVTTTRNACP